MKKYRIGACGYYGEKSDNLVNGQTIKTKNVTKELKKYYGEKLHSISYHTFRRNPLKNILNYFTLMCKSDNVVIFPDENAVKFFVPFSVMLKKLLGCRCYYVVIGGWLAKSLSKHKWLNWFMKRLDGIFVETSTMERDLYALGNRNLSILPNFKIYNGEYKFQDNITFHKPYKICFLSRVIGKKGIKELIDAVININENELCYKLDIYGPIDDDYKTEFEDIMKNAPQYISYKGVAEHSKAVEILGEYFYQAFPTKFRTEGHPGSILDSYHAGTPVLSARWDSWKDIIDDGQTGITFEFENFGEMEEKMLEIAKNPLLITSMREKCREKSKEFAPENIIKILIDKIEGKK